MYIYSNNATNEITNRNLTATVNVLVATFTVVVAVN